MLSDERIEEIANEVAAPVSRYLPYWSTSVDFARAIEAAVLPEGWVAVPKEATLTMLDCLRADTTSNLEKRYQAMLAAAPKPAQADPCHKKRNQPCQCSRKAMLCDGFGPDAAQAEKQEPVKDEPVAWWHYRINGEWDGFSKQNPPADAYDGGTLTPLYTRPQPDLSAAVERLKAERDSFYMDYRMKCDLETKQQAERIAALEETAREARDALQYKLHVVEAIAKLDAVLGNAVSKPTPD